VGQGEGRSSKTVRNSKKKKRERERERGVVHEAMRVADYTVIADCQKRDTYCLIQ